MGKEKGKRWIFNSVIIILFIVLIWLNYKRIDDDGLYDYCVEWESGLGRENLLGNCIDFVEGEIVCNWAIQSDNSIIIYDWNNQSNIFGHYRCVRYLKSIDVLVFEE